MNKFCVECLHSKYPQSIKNKFNQAAERLFVDECPMDDPLVIGCTTKRVIVDWNSFVDFLRSKKLLTEEEEEIIASFGPGPYRH